MLAGRLRPRRRQSADTDGLTHVSGVLLALCAPVLLFGALIAFAVAEPLHIGASGGAGLGGLGLARLG